MNLSQVVAGGKIPADGRVVDGRSHVDESMVTGKSKPSAKNGGDTVISGTVNSPLIVQVLRMVIVKLIAGPPHESHLQLLVQIRLWDGGPILHCCMEFLL